MHHWKQILQAARFIIWRAIALLAFIAAIAWLFHFAGLVN